MVSISFVAVTFVLLSAVSGFAWWRGGVWIAPFPYPYYPYPYYAPPVVEEPVIIQQQTSDVYVQPTPPQQPAEPVYWYYCQEAQGYYPYVKQCPKGWMKVVPTPPAPQPVTPKEER
ncbi:MAG: hypothetical protein P4L95_02700 [Rouxiella aceris]|uniref:hypothetical protein n=1 Tax=Rouxiella aceris TaxID=2703884 RepID=UPI002847FEA4|nr:hypothetical protein [Rouxiella aceris]MDR3430810.1 hypothetical protein [Rouxiella aceris]